MRVDRIHLCLDMNGPLVRLKAALVVVDNEGQESMIQYVGECHPRTKQRYHSLDEAMVSASELVKDLLAQPPLWTRSEVAQPPARVGSEVAG